MNIATNSDSRACRRLVSLPSALGAALGLLVAFTCGAQAQSAAPAEAEGSSAWTLGARSLPAPAAASDALRSAIAASPAPNVEQRRHAPAMTEDQWKAMQSAGAVDLEQIEQQTGVAIERSEMAGVVVYRVSPQKKSQHHDGHLFLHVHGGGYVLGGGDSAPTEAAQIAGAIGVEAISVDYRMPPDHPFPAAVEDAIAVYRHLLKTQPASSIAVGGTSAGGGLALATVHRAKSLGLDLPGAVWVGTPWADLTKTGDSLYTNEGIDRILVTYDGMLGAMARLYAGEHDLQNPLISPLYGDFTGFPPTQLVTGTRDMFLSDTARTHRKLRAAGVVADLNVYEGLSHAEYLMVPGSTESQQVFGDLGGFLLKHLTGGTGDG